MSDPTAELVESLRCASCGHLESEHNPEVGCVTQEALCPCTAFRLDAVDLIRKVSRAAYVDAMRTAAQMLTDLAARMEITGWTPDKEENLAWPRTPPTPDGPSPS